MKRNFSMKLMVAVVAAGLVLAAAPASAEVEEYERLISKAEFVVGLYGAIIGQVRSMVDPVEALSALQDRDLIPTEWDGQATITLGEAEEIFHNMGIQLFVEDPDVLLNSSRFERILRNHEGEIKRMKHHWDIVHGFSMGLELGEYRGRILSPYEF